MGFCSFRDYKVWHKSIALAKEVHRVSELLPRKEMFGLRDQLSRAATSVPSNIAEGSGRGSPRDFIHFLYISNGSISELETQLVLGVEYGYLKEDDIQRAMELAVETSKMLNSLIKAIRLQQTKRT